MEGISPAYTLPSRPNRSHARRTAAWQAQLNGSHTSTSTATMMGSGDDLAQEVIVPGLGDGMTGLSKPFHLTSPPNAAVRNPLASWDEGGEAAGEASASGWAPGPSMPSSIPMSASSSASSTCSTPSTSTSSSFPSPSKYFWSRSPFSPATPSTPPSTPLTPSLSSSESSPTFSSPRTIPLAERWDSKSFSIKLFFTQPGGPDMNSYDDHTLPPAFFPATKISFTPRLRTMSPEGLPYASLGGMHLGVTGVCETYDSKGETRTKRMFVDFCTDMSPGLNVWKRDGKIAARKLAGVVQGEWTDEEENKRLCLAPGTYNLPLSMKIPSSERLPPSFESSRFKISYTMSLAIFSSQSNPDGTPLHVKVFSTPFHILPSTLPSPSPILPTLTHEYKKSIMTNLFNNFSFSTPKHELGYHCVYPSIPTSHFSPTSHASIPVSLRVIERPLEPTDLYFRIALTRKIYVRESTHTSLATAIEDEWGAGLGLHATGAISEEVMCEPYVKEENEIVSRWGYVPYSARPGQDPMEKAEIVIREVGLPLEDWRWGYSTSLDVQPSAVPEGVHGESSWFSSAFRNRPPVPKEYGRHVHISARFYLTVEIGFATPTLGETLEVIKNANPDMEIPAPNNFTAPQTPATSAYTGASLTDPFSTVRSSSPLSSSSPPSPPFPGKLRHICIPITIGSVAEPSMNVISGHIENTAQRRREREMREERGEDTRGEGEGPEGAWICAPPGYEDACRGVPAYVWS